MNSITLGIPCRRLGKFWWHQCKSWGCQRGPACQRRPCNTIQNHVPSHCSNPISWNMRHWSIWNTSYEIVGLLQKRNWKVFIFKKEIWLITCGKSFRIVDDFFTLRTRFGLHDDSEVSNSCLNKTVQAERMSLTEPWISRLGQGKMNSRPAAGAEGIRRRRAWARGWC